jgi:hypothetical protein
MQSPLDDETIEKEIELVCQEDSQRREKEERQEIKKEEQQKKEDEEMPPHWYDMPIVSIGAPERPHSAPPSILPEEPKTPERPKKVPVCPDAPRRMGYTSRCEAYGPYNPRRTKRMSVATLRFDGELEELERKTGKM